MLLVWAVVVDLTDPAPPVALALAEQVASLFHAPRPGPAAPGRAGEQGECDRVGGSEMEGVVCPVELDCRAQAEVQALGVGVQLAVLEDHRHLPSSEVGRRVEDLVHGHLAGEALNQADDAGAVVWLCVLDDAAIVDRHEVRDHHHPGRRREDGIQEVGPVPVALVHLVPLVRMDLPAATLVRIQDPAEHGRVIESRQAEPVDAAVDTDQGRGAAVPDQSVGADRQIAVNTLRG